jgi:hypothetical protein
MKTSAFSVAVQGLNKTIATEPVAGDQAPAGTPGTGETVCPGCGGSGKTATGTCPQCQGTGKVIVGIGGG